MNKFDYFEVSDMRYHGAGVWAKVRAALRKHGYRVKDTYGQFTRGCNPDSFIELDGDGDLVYRLYQPKGKLVKISDVLRSVHRRLKVKTKHDPDTLNQVVEYLIGLGYKPVSDELLNSSVFGVHTTPDGLIYTVTKEATFNSYMDESAEIVYETETIVRLTNFTEKRKVIDVLGYNVHEDTLIQFLKNNLAN